jgi:hypothetical protein
VKERRKAPRFLAIFEIKYNSNGIVSFQSNSKSKNISKLGIKLPVYKLIKPGSKLKLEIEVPGVNGPIRAVGKVVWPKKTPTDLPGVVDAGIQFVNIDEDKITEIVKNASKKNKQA